MKHIMIDLETMGTQHNALVCSIGAVYFDPESGQVETDPSGQFHVFVDWHDAVKEGRKFEAGTVSWWLGQSKEARDALLHGSKTGVPWRTALERLSEFVGASGFQVWGNGSTFDISILEHAYQQAEMTVPWQYRNVRDMRTIAWLAKPFKATVPREGIKHDALGDAIYQAHVVNALYEHLKKGR